MDAKVANSAKFLDAISALSANFSTTAGGGSGTRSGDDAGFAKLMDQMQARARQAQDVRQAAENNRPRERAAAPKVAGLLSAQTPDRRDDAPPAPERAEAPAAVQPKDDAPPARQAAEKSAEPQTKAPIKASAKDAPRAADAATEKQAAQDQAAQNVAEGENAATEAAETDVAQNAEADATEAETEQAETTAEAVAESEVTAEAEAPVVPVVAVVTTEAAPTEAGAEIAAATAAATAVAAQQTADVAPSDEAPVAVVEAVTAPTASVPVAPMSPGEEMPTAPAPLTATDEAAPVIAATPVVAMDGQTGGQVAEATMETAPVVEALVSVTDADESVDIAALTEQTPATEETAAASTTQTADKPAEKTETKPTVAAPVVAAPTLAAAPTAATQVAADDVTAPTPAPVEAPLAVAADDAARGEENAVGKTAAAEGEAKPQAAKKADGEQVKTNPATAPNPAENADPRRGGDRNNERRNGGGENQRLSGGLGLAAVNELAPTSETAGGPAKFDSFLSMSADGVKQTTAQVGEAGAASGLRATRGGHAHLQQSGATDQVAVQIKKAAKDGIERISMQLRPEELGRVDVRMEIGQDGKVTAQIAVERAQTLELLQKDQKALEKALQEAGFNTDSGGLSFSLKEQGSDAYREQAEQNGGGRRRRAVGGQDEEDAAANVVAYTVNVAAGRVDVRV